MSMNNTLALLGDRKIRLLSKKFKSNGIELTFKMREYRDHKLRIELNDDCGIILDIFLECNSEFQTLILPVSDQRRLRITIYEGDEEIYQITMRIPAHYKPSAEYNGIHEITNGPVAAEPENEAAAVEKEADTSPEASSIGLVNGDFEVDFSQISERAVRMIDFKR